MEREARRGQVGQRRDPGEPVFEEVQEGLGGCVQDEPVRLAVLVMGASGSVVPRKLG